MKFKIAKEKKNNKCNSNNNTGEQCKAAQDKTHISLLHDLMWLKAELPFVRFLKIWHKLIQFTGIPKASHKRTKKKKRKRKKATLVSMFWSLLSYSRERQANKRHTVFILYFQIFGRTPKHAQSQTQINIDNTHRTLVLFSSLSSLSIWIFLF